jgi:hypothetical protein
MSLASVTGHYELFHALFRKENDPADRERVKDVTDFISSQGDTIRKFLDEEELRLIGLIMTHWHDHREGVSRHELGEIVHRQDKSVGMTTILKVYDDYIPTFKGSYDTVSTMSVINRCLEDYRKLMFLAYANEAKAIVTGGVTPIQEKGKRGEPDRVGLKDARTFLMEKLQSPLFSNGRTNQGGWMKDIAPQLDIVYRRDEERKKNHELQIPTGISILDHVLGGLERRSFNLILGAAGQRKSGLARTIAYNAASSGSRVLFIPLEMSQEEELQNFGAMFGQDPKYFTGTQGCFTVDRIHGTALGTDERKFLSTILIPEMQQHLGDKLAIIQPADLSWDNIRSIIEMENHKAPLDLIVLDYFARMDTSKARDKIVAINDYAMRAKDFILELDNKRGGAALLSPCHASRKGIEDAKANDGNYYREAVWNYSELEKSADLIMFTYLDPAMQKEGFLKLGTCKSRRSADVPAQLVRVDPGSNRIAAIAKETHKERAKAAESRKKSSNEPALDDLVFPEDD